VKGKNNYKVYTLDLPIFRRVFHFNNVPSTNSELSKRLDGENDSVDVLVSRVQSKGRGRRSNKWFSPVGGLWMSIPIPDIPLRRNISILNITCGISCLEACKKTIESTGMECRNLLLRWPNDIILDGKKLGGLLIEVKSEGESRRTIILGIGINVNLDTFPSNLKDQAISLYSYYGRRFSRKRLLVSILEGLEDMVHQIKENGTDTYVMKWKEYSLELGRIVKITTGKGEIKGGKAVGIGKDGELVIVEEDGGVVRIINGYDMKIIT
jgi:BirA family biotin operon repressor/biotin-[acetyl-CoA-carboxylase] ligase